MYLYSITFYSPEKLWWLAYGAQLSIVLKGATYIILYGKAFISEVERIVCQVEIRYKLSTYSLLSLMTPVHHCP